MIVTELNEDDNYIQEIQDEVTEEDEKPQSPRYPENPYKVKILQATQKP